MCILIWMVPESWVPSRAPTCSHALRASLGTEGRAVRAAGLGAAPAVQESEPHAAEEEAKAEPAPFRALCWPLWAFLPQSGVHK